MQLLDLSFMCNIVAFCLAVEYVHQSFNLLPLPFPDLIEVNSKSPCQFS
jgi:hypothetical protein